MKLLPTIIALFCIIYLGNAQTTKQAQPNTHKIMVEEVVQASAYTYLLGKENDKTTWLALPKIEASKGEIYYYQGGMEMKNFKSTELKRTFDSILFIEGVQRTDSFQNKSAGTTNTNLKPVPKLNKIINTVEGSITIAELITNKNEYANKLVKIRGQVTKYNRAIMGKNWIHIQDGTECSGENDLTITSEMETQKGEVIIVEGKIILDKDFGSGYFYKIIMEEGKIIE